MEEKNFQLTPELKEKAYSEAKSLLKKGKDAILKKLPEYLKKAVAFGIEVTKNIFEISKEAMSNKKQAQVEFLNLCDKIIDTCNGILRDGKVTEEEKMKLLDIVDNAFNAAEESNKQIQKDNKEIVKHAITVGGVTTGLTILGAVALALSKAFKKH